MERSITADREVVMAAVEQRSGVERSGSEWSGVERSEAEWSGVERSGGTCCVGRVQTSS